MVLGIEAMGPHHRRPGQIWFEPQIAQSLPLHFTLSIVVGFFDLEGVVNKKEERKDVERGLGIQVMEAKC